MANDKGIRSRAVEAEGTEKGEDVQEMTPSLSLSGEVERAAMHIPQVKICGLTNVDEALRCVEFGASAIGCVFYPRSPRNVSEDQAREICGRLPPGVPGVGVFVNETFEAIMAKVERCGLKAVQLHGRESIDLVAMLRREGLQVIKAVFLNGTPAISAAASYNASAILVECAGGPLPGGNALAWDWGAARRLGESRPIVVAGGLSAENVAQAIQAASPDALDVSSGVEASPGKKDLEKVKRFLHVVASNTCSRQLRNVFPMDNV